MKSNIKLISALRQEWNGGEHPNLYISGCGKVNAAMVTMEIIKDMEVSCEQVTTIINYGTAGSTTGVTGLVDCTKFHQRDMDVRPLGFKIGETPFERSSDSSMIDFSHIKNPIGKNLCCYTGDSFATDLTPYDDVVDMEAYALAKTCWKEHINFVSYKYITDNANEKSADDWLENCNKGIDEFKKILEYYDNI